MTTAGSIGAVLHILQRSGVFVPGCARSIWLHGDDIAHFQQAQPLIHALMRNRLHVRLLLTVKSRRDIAALRRAFPDDQVNPMPWNVRVFMRRFIRRTNPTVLLLLDGSEAPRRVAAWARQTGTPMLTVSTAGDPSATISAIDGSLPLSGSQPRHQELARLPTIRDRAGQSLAWQRVAPIFTKRRIDTIDALRARLGHPQSILCLGNGPSCEDSRVRTYAHDCLMRVNWRWQARGVLNAPDMVFVGDAATVHKVRDCVFGIWNQQLERALLLRHLVTRGPMSMEYATMDRLSAIIGEGRWHARPSNGALMVVAAAALQPKRLIIAGIDLFLHPAGRYADAPHAHNAYAHAHDRATDLAIIDQALRGYHGDVIVLSDILQDALTRYRRDAPHHA